MKGFRVFFVFMVLALCFTACPVSVETTPPETTPPEAPSNVFVNFNNNQSVINIGWNTVDGDVSYEIYRNSDNSDALIGTQLGNDTGYTDKEFPLGKNISYKVRTVSAAEQSQFRASEFLLVDIPEVAVRNTEVSILEYSDKNRITWQQIINPEVTPEYEVYRYLSKEDQNPVKVDGSITYGPENTLFIDDLTAIEKTFYYYTIRWKDSVSQTQGRASDFTFGLYVSTGDENLSEPNNDYEVLPYDVTSPNMTDLFIFKTDDHFDVDCFKYVGIPLLTNNVIFTVAILPEFQGKLNYEIIYNGSVRFSGVLLNDYPYMFLKFQWDDSSSIEEDTVYFRITPVSSADDFVCTYDITITTE